MPSTGAPSKEPLTPLTLQILLAVADQPRHGYGIIKEIVASTEGRLKPATGTVYLALRRMIDGNLIEHVARPEGDDQRRRFYAPTARGLAAVEAELRQLTAVLDVARRKRLLTSGSGSNKHA